jgi:hypothetical protein
MSSRRKKQRRARQREGAALLIVLFILLMATATGVFAMQSTQFEQRASGALHQATRAKFVAEGTTVNVMALCYQGGTTACTDLKRAPDNLPAAIREEHGLPNYPLLTEGAETVYSLTQADFPVAPGTNFRVDGVDTDRELGSAVQTVYEPAFMTVVEKWRVPNPGETRERYRLIVSTFGEITIDADHNGVPDDTRETNKEFRWGHETVSTTRAYFDVR